MDENSIKTDGTVGCSFVATARLLFCSQCVKDVSGQD